MEQKTNTAEHRIVKLVLFLLVSAALVFAASQLDYTAIADRIAGNGYEAPAALATIIDDLELTDDGMRILRATRPELQNKTDFNQSCSNLGGNTVVIGCFVSGSGHIYFYDIQNDELAGIKQSVLAHELLHAVWVRLSDTNKDKLRAEFDVVYDKNATVRDAMSAYDNVKDENELHSVIGQTVRPSDLPDSLRKHYAKYFSNHEKVVNYYEQYNEPLKKIEKRMEELKTEILAREEKLKTMQKEYLALNDQLTKDINQFNDCSNTAGCFSSEAQFNSARQALLTREQQLTNKYNEVQNYLAELNDLINEYNANASHNMELQESLKSN